MAAKLATTGPGGILWIYIETQTDWRTLMEEWRERESWDHKFLSWPKGIWVSMKHWAQLTHAFRIHMLLISQNPLGQISLVFIIWFQIRGSVLLMHLGEENEQQLLPFLMFCRSTSLALSKLPSPYLCSPWCWWDLKIRPILILSGSHSVLPLYLSVCSVQGHALTLFSQRIRHAECWGPLHTKRLGIRRKSP